MGTRVNKSTGITKLKVKGLRVRYTGDLVVITPTFNGCAWPVLAKRLEIQGSLVAAKWLDGEVLLSAREIGFNPKSLTRGHARKTKFKPIFVSALVLPVLILIASTPLGSRVDQPALSKDEPITNPCDDKHLRQWLIRGSDEVNIKSLHTSMLGGVVSGTFECLDARYSYTLGSDEPKRVLKLQKLDS